MALTITLPDDVLSLARQRSSESGLSSVEEYVARLIQADVATLMSDELEAELLKGMQGEAIDFREIDWEAKKQALRDRHSSAASK